MPDEVMKFILASKGGVILKTEGKYCTHNILVEPVAEDLTVTANGTYPVPEGHTGHGDLTVDVKPDLEALTVTENGTYTVPEGTDGYSEVTVDVQPPLADVTIEKDGTYPIPEGYYGHGEITAKFNPYAFDPVEITLTRKPDANNCQGSAITFRASDVGYVVGTDSGFGITGVEINGIAAKAMMCYREAGGDYLICVNPELTYYDQAPYSWAVYARTPRMNYDYELLCMIRVNVVLPE